MTSSERADILRRDPTPGHKKESFVAHEQAVLALEESLVFEGRSFGRAGHRDLPVISVQYHPEARPGPHESHYLFDDFVTPMPASRVQA
jgi:carbamoylphosphate synthase small subunit